MSIVSYWWCFATDPEFQEKQPWMQPVMRFFGLLHPNAWTWMRAPGGLVTCYLIEEGYHPLYSLLSIILFALTDWADGKAARFRNQVTGNGGILDGTIDKLFILPIIIYLSWKFSFQISPLWQEILLLLVVLMGISEASRILMPLSRRFDKKTHLHAILYGKHKFATQIISAFLLWLAVLIFSGWYWWPIWIGFLLATGTVLSIFSIVFRLYPELERYSADVVTLGNFACGSLSILFSLAKDFRSAVALIIIAGILDVADGFVARKTKPVKEKKGLSFGDIADDIGDFVSFALAPAVMLYALNVGLLSQLSAMLYGGATIARLIFFTIEGMRDRSTPGVFRGIPSPSAAIFLGSFFLWEHPLGPHALSLIGILLAGLEVAFFARWYHFRLISRTGRREQAATAIAAALAFFFLGSGESLSGLATLYLLLFSYPIANRCWEWDKR